MSVVIETGIPMPLPRVKTLKYGHRWLEFLRRVEVGDSFICDRTISFLVARYRKAGLLPPEFKLVSRTIDKKARKFRYWRVA